MICPKCKTENSDDSIFCAHCGHKLKIVCPRCKMTNSLKSQRCTSCGLRLIRICPNCQTPNSPVSEKCKKCDTILLKKCKSCGALNSLKATSCKKCAAPLQEEKPKMEYTPRSVILINLANGDELSKKFGKKELSEKLIKKFFQVILSNFKAIGLKAYKLSAYTIGSELTGIDDVKMAEIAKKILSDFEETNHKLANVNVLYSVKTLVSQSLSPRHKFGIDLISKLLPDKLCLDAASAISLGEFLEISMLVPGVYIANGPKQKPVEQPVVAPQPQPAPPPQPAQPEQQVQTPEETQVPPAQEVQPQAPEVQQAPAPQEVPPAAEEEDSLEEIPIQHVVMEQDDEQATVQQGLENLEAAALEIQAAITPETPPTQEAPQTPAPQAEPAPAQPQPEAAPQPTQPQPQKEPERNLIAEKIKTVLTTKPGGFIALVGDAGIGKKTVFNFALSQIPNHNFCLLQADCHTSINSTPFATIQNLVRSMFSLPIVNFEAEKMQTTVRNALINSIGINDEKVIKPLLNLIVPKPRNVDVDVAKNELIYAIDAMFKAIKNMQKVILLIKEIEFMDRPSAEILDTLVDRGFLNDAFFVTTTSENSHISAFMTSPKFANHNLGSIRISALKPEEIQDELGFYIKNPQDIPPEIVEQIKTKTQGSPFFLEEIIIFLSQSGLAKAADELVTVLPEIKTLVLPDSVDEVLAVRLESLFAQNEVLHQVIANAACLGYSFYPLIIQRVLGIDNQTFGLLINILVTAGILITHDNVNFKFKNKKIYSIIKNFVIHDEELEKQINENLLKIMLDMNESNSSQTAEIAMKAQNYQQAYVLWTMAAKEAISTGDRALAFKAQKLALETIEYSDIPDKEIQTIQLQEKLGIENYQTEPEDAINFLGHVIQYYEDANNGEKIMELSAYIVKAFDVVGSTQQAVEYIDKAISYINPNTMGLEIALLKYQKLKFLVESGYLGEAITLIQSEIMPSLQAGVKTEEDFSPEESSVIKEAVNKSQIQLIKALSLQGNKNYYSVLELFVTNNPSEAAQVEIFVIDAMHKTLNGTPDEAEASIRKTENILKGLQVENRGSLLLELDIVRLLGKVLYSDNYNVAHDVPFFAKKSKEMNNAFVYNIIQILFIYQLLKNKDYAQAANMTNECLNYFASQKIALFAIPGWAILSRIQAGLGDFDAAISIAQQALEVASKPQIQNNYYIVAMKRLLSEYFAAKNDFDMAKMHLEQAIEFARSNDMMFMQAILYIDLAKIDLQGEKEPKENITKLLESAETIATTMESKFLKSKIEPIKNSLNV